MDIRSIAHRGLRRFIVKDDSSGLPAAFVEKIRNIVSFLQDMGSTDELRSIPGWRAHQLSSNRRDTWSLTVNRNWRITFRVDESDGTIVDLNFEDYH